MDEDMDEDIYTPLENEDSPILIRLGPQHNRSCLLTYLEYPFPCRQVSWAYLTCGEAIPSKIQRLNWKLRMTMEERP